MNSLFELSIIGSNSAISAFDRFPTAQYLQIHSHVMLIDCGEATQFRLDKFGLKKSAIQQIFISHLHGDHYYGLIGLLTSFNLAGRVSPLQIFGPAGLEEIISLQLRYGGAQLRYPIDFRVTSCDAKHLLFENESYTVHSFPLKHRIDTTGFLFREKAVARRIKKQQIEAFQLSIGEIVRIKNEESFTRANGEKIIAEDFLMDARDTRSYAYCSDTMYFDELATYIQGADLLYHEATFEHKLQTLAATTMHSTTRDAALVAQQSGAKKLLLGHFSSRYKALNFLLNEAKQVFPNTELAIEGQKYTL